jgi:putative hydrolase of the HAD superfamily
MQDDRSHLLQQEVQERRYSRERLRQSIDASEINITLLKVLSFDLDGTIFKKGLDDVFWNEKIPELLAEKKKMPFNDVQRFVIKEYEKIGQDDARWYIPEYWFDLFDLDIPVDMVLDSVDYASGIYEDTYIIQEFAKTYTIIISTNNPRSILEHKLKVFKYVDHITHTFSSISDFGNIVKNRQFYANICGRLGIKPQQMLHVGDNNFYDVLEPRAVGINALLIDRDGENSTIHSLHDLRLILKNH